MEYQGNTDYDDDDDDDAGEHTDYNEGFVLPMALPLVTLVVGRSHHHHCYHMRYTMIIITIIIIILVKSSATTRKTEGKLCRIVTTGVNSKETVEVRQTRFYSD